jgi:hypothetical protein
LLIASNKTQPHKNKSEVKQIIFAIIVKFNFFMVYGFKSYFFDLMHAYVKKENKNIKIIDIKIFVNSVKVMLLVLS